MLKQVLLLFAVSAIASASNGPKRLFKHQSPGEGIAAFADPYDGVEYRLPNQTKPIHYDIWLSTAVHQGNFAFEGRVTILIDTFENTSEITLHYRQINIQNVKLMREAGGNIQSNVSFSLNPATEFLIIRPNQMLTAPNKYQIQITYTGTLRSDDAGFYRSSYVNPAGATVWLATTQFESTDARHAFPW